MGLGLNNSGRYTDPDAPVFFSDFVPEHIAKQYVKAGNIFCEYNYVGDALHGKYSHRLQWYIILTAKENGLLETDNLSSQELLYKSADVWQHLLDRYQKLGADNQSVGFQSPHYLHASLLLLKDKLPHLSGTLRKIFSRSIETIAKQQKQETPFAKICAEYDIREGSFHNLYSDTIPSEKYYRSKQKANLKVVYKGSGKYSSVFFKERQSVEIKKSVEDPVQHLEPVKNH